MLWLGMVIMLRTSMTWTAFRSSTQSPLITVWVQNAMTIINNNTLSISKFCFKLQQNLCLQTKRWGSRDGTVIRALVSHQCGLGLNPGVDPMCGLSLLLVLFAQFSKGFFAGSPVVLPPKKSNISKFQFDLETVDREPLLGCATANSQQRLVSKKCLCCFSG